LVEQGRKAIEVLLLDQVFVFDGVGLSLKDLVGPLQECTLVFEVIDLLVDLAELGLESFTKVRLHLGYIYKIFGNKIDCYEKISILRFSKKIKNEVKRK
jgi:hypothetical protein